MSTVTAVPPRPVSPAADGVEATRTEPSSQVVDPVPVAIGPDIELTPKGEVIDARGVVWQRFEGRHNTGQFAGTIYADRNGRVGSPCTPIEPHQEPE